MRISELKALNQGSHFQTLLLLRRKILRQTKTQEPFFILEFVDTTGTFGSTVFSNSHVYGVAKDIEDSTPVVITGTTSLYNGRFSPQIQTIRIADTDDPTVEAQLELLYPSAPEGRTNLVEELHTYIASIGHDTLRQVVTNIYKEYSEQVETFPAASQIHHAYASGLLEHTVHMARIATALFPTYPYVDRDLAMAGILLHDIGKVHEYTISGQRTTLGMLQGHLLQGYTIFRRAAMTARLSPAIAHRIEHIIISHHNEPSYGAITRPATPEAIFVSLIDNLDAKMGTLASLVQQANPDAEFSEFSPVFQTPVLLQPISTATA